MPRTLDRFVAGDYRCPGFDRDAMELWRRLAEVCPAFVADNVRDYVQRLPDLQYHSPDFFPCLALPFDSLWVEYPSLSGRQRRAVFMLDHTEMWRDWERDGRPHNVFQELLGGAVDDAREQGYDGPIRWVTAGMLLVEEDKQVLAPVAWMALALNERGQAMGNRWIVTQPAMVRTGHEPGDIVMAAFQIAFHTLAFLHCRNARVERFEPEAKLDKAWRRRHPTSPGLVRYHTLRLEVPRRSGDGRYTHGELGPGSTALHIVAGNFHHYGDCCPVGPGCPETHSLTAQPGCRRCGGHLAHGKLFGRLEGVYWVPQHMRGDAEAGTVVTDFQPTVKGAR